MKTLSGVLVIVFMLLIFPLTGGFSFEGPFQIKNLYPIFLHAGQPYLEKAAMENSMSYSLSHSSTYTVQRSADWIISLDMEATELAFRYKRMIKDHVEFDMDIPVLIIGGGFMDGFLEDYHNSFGFPDYGRSDRPNNDFLYEIKDRKDGTLFIKGKSGIRIGDIRLGLKKPLITSDGFEISIKGDVEIPVGNAKQGYGNGSVDALISVLLDKKITDRIMTHWNIGGVFPGDVKGHEKIELDDFIFGGAAIEADLGRGFSLLLQVQGQSSIYPETDLLAVDREAWLLAFGGRYQKGKRSFDLSLTEDINRSGAPDFILNLAYKMNL
ncbi:MAG: DUF3187 family protein [Nitrospiraceae bacterium]|nr:MAG: DUF3187 family protein [Nitrospiraceae bacterium]